MPALEYDLEVRLGELDACAVAALEALQPTGMGNPAPVFRCRARVEDMRRVGREGAHLRLSVQDESGRLGGVMFSAGERAEEGDGACDLLFSPKINVWQDARGGSRTARHGTRGRPGANFRESRAPEGACGSFLNRSAL